MRQSFVDSSYYIALLIEGDSLHAKALQLASEMRSSQLRLVTTDAVLTEVLTRLSHFGEFSRARAADLVDRLRGDVRVSVLAQDRATFDAGLALYRKRPDKDYSMTDCMSMAVCRRRQIQDVLTADHDFEQEGFTILL